MNYIANGDSNMGIAKVVNEDALLIKSRRTLWGNVCLCVVADGVGGLAKGEIASSHIIRRFMEWFMENKMETAKFSRLLHEAKRFLGTVSDELLEYGRKEGFAIGSTATVLLIRNKEYGLVHVGDTRCYVLEGYLFKRLHLLTKDQSVEGNVLIQAVGATKKLEPQIIRGKTSKGQIFFLCSDGLRHNNDINDLSQGIKMCVRGNEEDLSKVLRVFIDRARQLGEKDDITGAIVCITD